MEILAISPVNRPMSKQDKVKVGLAATAAATIATAAGLGLAVKKGALKELKVAKKDVALKKAAIKVNNFAVKMGTKINEFAVKISEKAVKFYNDAKDWVKKFIPQEEKVAK